jgi:hypothetical protein
VLRAEGREARGQGNAAATITAALEPSGKGTRVSVVTDLSITGKVAQFGRGVLADVSAKLLGQFVENLEATVIGQGDGESKAAGGEPAGGEPAAGRARGGRRRSRAADPVPAAQPADITEAIETPAAAEEREAIDAELASTNGAARQEAPATDHDDTAEEDVAEVAGGGATDRKLEPVPAEPVDLVEVAGGSIARRVVPVLAAAAVVALLIALLRRRRG